MIPAPLVNPRLDQCDVLSLVQAERAYQDHKWGGIAEHPHAVAEWLLVMQGKLDEAITLWQDSDGNDVSVLKKVLYLVAVGVACLEQHAGAVVAEVLSVMERDKDRKYLKSSDRAQAWWPALEAIRNRAKEQANHATPTEAR